MPSSCVVSAFVGRRSLGVRVGGDALEDVLEVLVVGDDLLGRRVQEDASLVDDDDAVGVLAGLGQVVRGEEERAALLGLGAHRLPESAARQRIHAGRWLVEDQEIRIAGQSQGQAHALTLATGELVEGTLGELREVRALQELVGGNRVSVHRSDQVDRVADLPVARHRPGLKHRAHQRAAHGLARAHAVAADVSLRGGGQAEDDVQEGALARTVDAEERHDFAGHEGQVYAAQGVDVAERLMDVRRLEGGRYLCVHGIQSARVEVGSEVPFDAGVPMTNVMGTPAQTTYVLRGRVECMDDESRGEEFRRR